MVKNLLYFFVGLFTLVLQSCNSCQNSKEIAAEKQTISYNEEEFSNQLIQAIQDSELDSIVKKTWIHTIHQKNYTPIINSEKSVAELKSLFERADEHGLQFYFEDDLTLLDQFNSFFEENRNSKNLSANDLAKKEFEIRNLALKYGKAIQFGIVNPKEIFARGYYVNINMPDSLWHFNQFEQDNYVKYLTEYKVKHIQYDQLKKAYNHFKENPDTAWKKLPELPKKILKEGDQYQGAQILRQRFRVNELPDTSKNYHLYDSTLVNGLKKFQASYGLKSDGVLGPATLNLLNTSPTEIQHKLEATLERFRWNTGINYENLYLVNIPEYKLHVFENDKEVRNHSIGVGLANQRHTTPEFIDTMQYVVVNPKWYLPHSIATKEVLPNAQMDPFYLIENHYKVYLGKEEIFPYSVDWYSFNEENFPFRFEQMAGEWNSLGRIKFLFPNKYSIYFHDTPSKYIFGRDGRAVSHGCVRVEKPFELGEFIMQGNKEYEKILDSLYSESEQFQDVKFKVEKPYPVFITYYTAWADEKGKIQFRDDVYKRDEVLLNAIARLKTKEQ